MKLCSRAPRCTRKGLVGRMGLCQAHYNQWLAQREAKGLWITGWVPSDATIAHIGRLKEAGMSYRQIAQEAGVTDAGMRLLRKRTQVLAMTEARILAVPIPVTLIQTAAPAAHISPVGSARRAQALIAAGHTVMTIAEVAGCTTESISALVNGRNRYIKADLARRIDRAFRELELVPGTDLRAKRRAERKGWALPLAWDEDTIDDPAAEPQMPKGSRTDWYDDYLELKSMRLDDEVIAKRLGIPRENLRDRVSTLRKRRAA